MTNPKLLIGSFAVFLVVGGAWLYARQSPGGPIALQLERTAVGRPSAIISLAPNMLTVDTLTATPGVVVVNTLTTITVSVPITDPSYIPNSANLVRLGSAGAPTTSVGQLYDDGTHGDETAGDHIYTTQVSFTEATVGQIQLEVSAAFKGSLKRFVSLPLTIPVWQKYSQPTVPVSFGYPSFPGVPFSIDLRYGGSVVAFDVQTNTGTLLTLSGLTISTGNINQISLTDWFAQNIDSSNLLIDDGTYSLTTLPDGTEELILTGAAPAEWTGGPLQEAYIMSPDRAHIAVVQISADNPFIGNGISSEDFGNIVNLISQTIKFQ